MEPERDCECARAPKSSRFGSFFRKYQVLVLTILMLILVKLPLLAYGILMECGEVQNISPPAFFVTIQMIMQPCLVDTDDYISRKYLRKILTIGSLVLAFGVISAGFAGLLFNERNIIFSLFYGPLGGIGAFVITALLRKILQGLFGANNSHVIDVVQGASQGFSQLLFPLLLAQIRTSFGAQMGILFLGSIVLHTLPLGLILSRSKLQLSVHNLVRYKSVALDDPMMDVNAPNSMKRWGNLMGINNNGEDDDDDLPMKNLTSQGVEIMDTIPEEDEISENSVEMLQKKQDSLEKFRMKKWKIFREYWQECRKILSELFVNPFRILFGRQIILPGVILKAFGIFVHILVISGLPCFTANNTLHLNSLESSTILAIMAIPIVVITFSSIWMEDLLQEKGKYWHIVGEICKFVGCIVFQASRTIFFLRLGILLLGVGEGIKIIQERILRECTIAEFGDEITWRVAQSYISAVSGYFVLIFTFCTNQFLAHFTFGTIFLITGLFYSAAIFIFALVHYF
ncbi:uncharacterized protein LOC129790868 [Lutzomyia longipalpis]|uniref:uncharacterized protein LOC129790868 n=1 Tax=Lutzomyia longipalpis TaxID=7200 RepID=UPI002483D268|nr:uncharacterized protein LOC129790868 [Lutzomyia longipalpis]